MTRRLGAGLLLIVGLATALVQAASYSKFEALAVAGSAVGFTAANINNLTGIHPPATSSTCRLELAEIRWTTDRTTPTASVGTLLEVGEILTLVGNDSLNDFRAIRTTAVSAQLDCTHAGAF